jgi:urease accessory protein
MRDEFSIAVVTNDIYTSEDAMMLARLQALPEEHIMGVNRWLPPYGDPRGCVY